MKLIAAENLLASHGFSTFDLTPNVDALNNAIDMIRPMADDMPAQLDAALHTSLAHWLCLRIDKNLETTSIDDVNRAISLLTSALDAIDLDDPSRPLCLGNMAGIYMQKFIMLRTQGWPDDHLLLDLDQAVRFNEMALDSLQPEQPLRVDYLDRVGVLLSTRSKISQDLSDRQKSLDCLKAAWRVYLQDKGEYL